MYSFRALPRVVSLAQNLHTYLIKKENNFKITNLHGFGAQWRPNWHLEPESLGGHSHTYPPGTVLHTPPLRHGDEPQGSESSSQLTPLNRWWHEHSYSSPSRDLQVPPFRHGWVPQMPWETSTWKNRSLNCGSQLAYFRIYLSIFSAQIFSIQVSIKEKIPLPIS